MSIISYDAFKTIFQYLSLVLALVFNIILIYLINNKSPVRLGSYKYLMLYFCVFAIFFAIMDIIVQPIVQAYGSCFFMLVKYKDTYKSQEIAQVSSAVLCGCFGVMLYTIAIHFIFRYFALERKGNLVYFRGSYLKIWLLLPIIAGIYWTCIVHLVFGPNEKSSNYLRKVALEQYDINIDEVAYLAACFHFPDEYGTPRLNKPVVTALTVSSGFAILPMSAMVFCAIKCYFSVRQLIESGDSLYTKQLQKQLYKALVFQAIIPLVLMFIPMGILFVCPIFEADVRELSKIVTFTYALYPAVDPLPIIMIVDNYRFEVIGFFNRVCGSECANNRIEQTSDELTSVSRNC